MFEDEIATLFSKNGKINKNASKLLKRFPELTDALNLIDSKNIAEKIHLVLNGEDARLVCPSCNRPHTFLGFDNCKSLGYAQRCTNMQCPAYDHTEANEKRKATVIEKYGFLSAFGNVLDEHGNQRWGEAVKKTKSSDEYKQKFALTMKKVGKERVEVMRKTCLEKYGVEYVFLRPEFYQQRNKRKIDHINECLGENFQIVETTVLGKPKTLLHTACGTKFDMPRFSLTDFDFYCPVCTPKDPRISSGCRQVLEFIKANYQGEIMINDRTTIGPYEIDIYLPELKLGFEYNGLYWHSEKLPKKENAHNYHKFKADLCDARGITLINIFEDDWFYKTDIVKSRIAQKVKSSATTLYARKCTVKEIDSKTMMTFLSSNHLNGGLPSAIRFGLYHEDVLVSVMTFCKSRFHKNIEWEILRFASLKNTNIVGAASKLFNHFTKTLDPNSVMTYADRCWGKGSFYETLGFTYVNDTKPGYSYYWEKKFKRISRINLRKNSFEKFFEVPWDDELDEVANAKRVKAYRIWDCGSSVYFWNKQK